MPLGQLKDVSVAVVGENAAELKKLGTLNKTVWSYLANDIAKPFNVSPAVIECRISREGLDKQILLEDLL